MKKVVSFILALAVSFTMLPSAFAADAASRFTDVPEDAWYRNELNYALEHGFINGTGETTFSPDESITRGQFVTILGRMLGAASTESGSNKFTDVDADSYYAPYVNWAAQNGYVNGTSGTIFSPDAAITIEQIGVILANYIEKSGAELTESEHTYYSDMKNVSDWAADGMKVAEKYDLLPTEKKYIVASDSHYVHPKISASRAVATVAIVRLSKGDGLGGKSYTLTDLWQKSVTDSLFPGEYQWIMRHEADDMAAVDNNIRYMLKYGVTEMPLDITGLSFDPDQNKLPPYYADATWNEMAAAVGRWLYPCNNAVSAIEYAYEYTLQQYEDVIGKPAYYNTPLVDFYDNGTHKKMISLNSWEDISEYQQSGVFNSAKKVYDEMWSPDRIKESMSEKEKARVYLDWIIKNCSYATDDYEHHCYDDGLANGESWSAIGVFFNGKAVCEGYTKAYNLLLRTEGIDCGVINVCSPSHMFSSATLDGVLYHIDATYADTSGNVNKYFCMTPEASLARFK